MLKRIVLMTLCCLTIGLAITPPPQVLCGK